MKRLALPVAPVAVALLALVTLPTGCAGTSAAVQKPFAAVSGDRFAFALAPHVDVPADALALLDARLASQLATPGTASATKTAEIAIVRFGGAKPVGMERQANEMASTVTVRDAASGAVLGSFSVESKNPGSWRTSNMLIEEHADRIAATLKGRP